jgi:hypothetical protein
MKGIALMLLFHVIGISLYAQQLSWKISSQKSVHEDGQTIAMAGFADKDWVPGIVPGTVFYAYVKAGKEQDPDYADNIYKVDAAKYNQPFWYRSEFAMPVFKKGQRVWLKFNGVNKYADIFFNGHQLGHLAGFMQRGLYDVTDLLKARNAVAVLVTPPKFDPEHNHPLANWESPTYICAGSWDWMPAVPGLNSGITDTVALAVTGPVSISDPWVRADLPDTTMATVHVSAQLTNSSPAAVTGRLKALITPGNIEIVSNELTLEPGTSQEVPLVSQALRHPRLWWPNGYGEAFLYSCKLNFENSTPVAASRLETTAAPVTTSFGIRKVTSDTTALNGPMRVYINDVPVLLKGGNWGMSDYMLKARGKDYDTRIRFHKEMNFNTIRNWTGEVTDEDFYKYCDQYGIMVWDDFWLNNLGGIDSLEMFRRNAVEKLKRLRNHPSIIIWCGANEGVPEGNPNGPLSNAITGAIKTYDGDYRLYLPRSNASVLNPNFSIHGSSRNLSGSGIWANVEPKTYFTDPHNGYLFSTGSWGMRSELGMATFVNPESLKKFMPAYDWVAPTPDSVNSKTNMWARHFFSTDGAIGGGSDPVRYINDINKRYGHATSLDDFCKKAQLLNEETMKAMFEGWNDHMWNDASGMLIWMSQSAYPSMIWQTYDYYYDLTAAYFGAKSACEPLHVQFNPATRVVKVINNERSGYDNLSVEARIYNSDGKEVTSYAQEGTVRVAATATADAFKIPVDSASLTPVYFLRLKLHRGGKLVSENTYMMGKQELNYTALNELPAVHVTVSKAVLTKGVLTYKVSNPSGKAAAVGVRVQLLDNAGKQILPAFINDSYFTLMQGESKDVTVSVNAAQLKNGYRLEAKAYND